MNHLDATTKSWQVVLAGAVTTTQLPFVASWVDSTLATGVPTTFAAVEGDGATNSTTPVTVVAAPASSHQIQVKSFSLFNADTAAATATVILLDSATSRTIVKVTLQAGYTLEFTDTAGWFVTDTNGSLLQSLQGVGSGTVTSVAVTVGTGMAVSGSPITTAGTIALSLTTNERTRQITYSVTGSGSALTASSNFTVDVPCEYSGTIAGVRIVADQSGSLQVGIAKTPYSTFPGSLTSIVASDPPVLSAAQKSLDTTLTGWTTTVTGGDIFRFSITSVSTITRFALDLLVVTS